MSVEDSVYLAFPAAIPNNLWIGARTIKVDGVVGTCVEVGERFNIFRFTKNKNDIMKVVMYAKA